MASVRETRNLNLPHEESYGKMVEVTQNDVTLGRAVRKKGAKFMASELSAHEYQEVLGGFVDGASIVEVDRAALRERLAPITMGFDSTGAPILLPADKRLGQALDVPATETQAVAVHQYNRIGVENRLRLTGDGDSDEMAAARERIQTARNSVTEATAELTAAQTEYDLATMGAPDSYVEAITQRASEFMNTAVSPAPDEAPTAPARGEPPTVTVSAPASPAVVTAASTEPVRQVAPRRNSRIATTPEPTTPTTEE